VSIVSYDPRKGGKRRGIRMNIELPTFNVERKKEVWGFVARSQKKDGPKVIDGLEIKLKERGP
jgi:hypothetical protein